MELKTSKKTKIDIAAYDEEGIRRLFLSFFHYTMKSHYNFRIRNSKSDFRSDITLESMPMLK